MINEMKFLKDLEYTKTGGSNEELEAAKYIQKQLKSIGLKSEIETFKVPEAKIEHCSLEVTSPYKKKIECKAYYNSGTTNGLTKEIFHFRKNNKANLSKVKDKIVLYDTYLNYWLYKDLVEAGCAGIIISNGYLYEENRDIDQRELREKLKEVKSLPIVQINIKDLYELIQKDARKVKIVNKQKVKPGESRNVVCKIKGEITDTVVFTAHYDSTALSKGIYDNLTGAISILKCAEYYSKHKPHHSLVFVFCGSEERGLCGSKAYVEKHKKELDAYKLCINVDMVGSVLGHFIACVTAEKKLQHYVEYLANEVAFGIDTRFDVYSSDSTPFADNGVPAISFARLSPYMLIHNRHDTLYEINAKQLKEDINFILEFSKHMCNAKVMPVDKEIPEDIKKLLDIYLNRKRK